MSGGNYCGIGDQAAGIPRQRALAVEVLQVDGHGAILSRPVHTARPVPPDRREPQRRHPILLTVLSQSATDVEEPGFAPARWIRFELGFQKTSKVSPRWLCDVGGGESPGA
ncbi:hypothetical protein GCM10010503_40140 [Streptomyces lucensis JCM 4490]|uniref:Uncharacterized protein n=1 Tax=Streptomyces lucensis JCM 4490 TaxID=1306176 RepID=A0A918J825_9ACTN|nr:hypothetical protein GCM10010503_40140 [Streptomyces lucensis JCM 4490]